MDISIIGTGYVGLISGVCFAEKGHRVTCVDIDCSKVEKINNGCPPIFENGLDVMLSKNIIEGRLKASNDLRKAVLESELSIVAVGTPFDGKIIDLSYVKKVAQDIGLILKDKEIYHTVIVKSTVIPGTTNNVVMPILEQFSGKKEGKDFGVGVNPEFLREGCAIKDFMNPDRIVIGGNNEKVIKKLIELYSVFNNVDRIITNNTSAEMIKYTSNSLFGSLISFSNEIGNICALTPGVDVKDVMVGVHLDKRLNPILADGSRINPGFLSYLEAGCGFGGSCFPKDIKALVSYAENLGEIPRLLKSILEINQNQPYKLIQALEKYYKSFEDLNIAILGLAFKPDTDDMRESPAIPVIESLLKRGAHIKAYDPVAKEEAKKVFGAKNIEYLDSLNDVLLNVDVVILITKWAEFNNLDQLFNNLEQKPLIIDGRRMLNKSNYERYIGVGLGMKADDLKFTFELSII
jgi:UDPglucose 6-dehydrogenase